MQIDNNGNTKLYGEGGKLIAEYNGKKVALYLNQYWRPGYFTENGFWNPGYQTSVYWNTGEKEYLPSTGWYSSLGWEEAVEVIDGKGIYAYSSADEYPQWITDRYGDIAPDNEPSYYGGFGFDLESVQ